MSILTRVPGLHHIAITQLRSRILSGDANDALMLFMKYPPVDDVSIIINMVDLRRRKREDIELSMIPDDALDMATEVQR